MLKAPAVPEQRTAETPKPAPRAATRFLGLTGDYSVQENARVVIVPVPYDTPEHGRGCSRGPQAVLEASRKIERFDDELWTEPYRIGIHSHKEVLVNPIPDQSSPPFNDVFESIKPLVEFGKFPIVLGGEQGITLGALRACVHRFQDLSLLQIGAHSSCRQSLAGNPYAHSAVTYHAYKLLPKPLVTQVGVRGVSADEVTWMEKYKPNINIYWARQQEKWNLTEIVSTLTENVYLSINVNAFDSSIMPSAGTPEPGGIGWYQMLDLLKILCVRRNVVGADIVELAPIAGLDAPNFLIAKLIYKLIGYRFALDLGVTKKYL